MLSMGFSPCPNDTFIFYAIVNKEIDTRGIDFEFIIEDVETLNQLALDRKIDITKASCHAFYHVQDDYQFLRSGAAFGRGCGPLLVVKNENIEERKLEIKKIAIPGELTTAFLLLKLYITSVSSFKRRDINFIAMPFYEIMDAVRQGKVDGGLIIHESRFTYQDYGLTKIKDLGEWWEGKTGLPIPLGGIIAKKSIGMAQIKIVEDLIRSSIKYSISNIQRTMRFIKKYSQELTDEVILEHISLYVNDYTIDIGKEGEAALKELMKMARQDL